MFYYLPIAFLVLLFSCKSKVEKTRPIQSSITESIYASGMIKSKDQYDAYVTVSGNIDSVFVSEGDTVKKGDPILSIADLAQHLARENAVLAMNFADLSNNQEKLRNSKTSIQVAKSKYKNDSILYIRQKSLWQQNIGTKIEFEARELAFSTSKAALYSAVLTYNDLKRQLDFTSSQAKKNLSISSKLEKDYTLRSDLDGVIFSLPKDKGEIVNPQTILAVIGNATNFILEMQVDEYDILKVRSGQKVLVTMDSYKDKVFEAKVIKIYPFMIERSKTFLVEAVFTDPPTTLYPNISFEANIILETKTNALLIPRNYIYKDSFVVKSTGDTVVVKTGLKDYKQIEILSGVSARDELQKTAQ